MRYGPDRSKWRRFGRVVNLSASNQAPRWICKDCNALDPEVPHRCEVELPGTTLRARVLA